MTSASNATRLGVDIGGTFTDVVLEVGTKSFTHKVLTEPSAPEQGVLRAIAEVVDRAGIVVAGIDLIIHGTTLATNALIERRGAVTALLTTAGFRDALEMRTENRYEQYDVSIDFPPPLIPRSRRFPVDERIDSRGKVLVPLSERMVEDLVPTLKQRGVEAVAISFLHSYINPDHEQRTRDILTGGLTGVSISLSSDVSPEMREYERTSTTAANAYVQPLMTHYLENLENELRSLNFRGPLLLMLSGGGLTTVETATRFPVRMVESGPAGGAIFAADVAALCDFEKVLSFDMGGTTAKICMIDGFRPQTARQFEVARAYRFKRGSGLPIRIPVIEMVEIGAGGGSVASVDVLKTITVGPESAGADPGPACYGRGGKRPTVTDADLVLGRVDAERFSGGRIRLDEPAARTAISTGVGDTIGMPHETAAIGISEMVDENMMSAARVHAIESGKDVSARTLIAFGGAAPLHAARLAEKLGISRFVVPVAAGVGSAVGFLKAPIAYELVQSGYQRFETFDAARANALLDGMSRDGRAVVESAALGAPLSEQRFVYMRYTGQGHELAIAVPERTLVPDDRVHLKEAFEAQYRSLFSWTVPVADVEMLSWIVVVTALGRRAEGAPASASEYTPEPDCHREMYDVATERFVRVPIYQRSALQSGAIVRGPAVIVEDETTTIVSSDFTAGVDGNGFIVCVRTG